MYVCICVSYCLLICISALLSINDNAFQCSHNHFLPSMLAVICCRYCYYCCIIISVFIKAYIFMLLYIYTCMSVVMLVPIFDFTIICGEFKEQYRVFSFLPSNFYLQQFKMQLKSRWRHIY